MADDWKQLGFPSASVIVGQCPDSVIEKGMAYKQNMGKMVAKAANLIFKCAFLLVVGPSQ